MEKHAVDGLTLNMQKGHVTALLGTHCTRCIPLQMLMNLYSMALSLCRLNATISDKLPNLTNLLPAFAACMTNVHSVWTSSALALLHRQHCSCVRMWMSHKTTCSKHVVLKGFATRPLCLFHGNGRPHICKHASHLRFCVCVHWPTLEGCINQQPCIHTWRSWLNVLLRHTTTTRWQHWQMRMSG